MKKGLKITYDKVADAMYISLAERKIKSTKEVSDLIFVDVDSKNQPVGIEILNVSRRLKNDILKNSANKPSGIPLEILGGAKVLV